MLAPVGHIFGIAVLHNRTDRYEDIDESLAF